MNGQFGMEIKFADETVSVLIIWEADLTEGCADVTSFETNLIIERPDEYGNAVIGYMRQKPETQHVDIYDFLDEKVQAEIDSAVERAAVQAVRDDR